MALYRVGWILVFADICFSQGTSGLESHHRHRAYRRALLGTSCDERNSFVSMVSCADRKGCVRKNKMCDGQRDCSDGSDETESACQEVQNYICPQIFPRTSSRFQCSAAFSGSLEMSRVCDGHADCPDGSDEVECKRCFCKNSARPRYFQCKYGACIDKEKKCDGRRDCPDGSDEEDCDKLTYPTEASPHFSAGLHNQLFQGLQNVFQNQTYASGHTLGGDVYQGIVEALQHTKIDSNEEGVKESSYNYTTADGTPVQVKVHQKVVHYNTTSTVQNDG